MTSTTRGDGAVITAIDGKPIVAGEHVKIDFGTVSMSTKGHAECAACEGHANGADLAAVARGRLEPSGRDRHGGLSQLDIGGASWAFAFPRDRGLYAGCDCGHSAGLCDGSVATGSVVGLIRLWNSCAPCRRLP